MTTKISGNNLQADISIDTTGNQIFNGTLKLDGNFPTGTDNVALGNTALDNGSLTGSQNVAIGTGTLTDTDSGADNTAVGFEALKVVTTGTNNTGIGSGAGSTVTTGSNLTLLGYNAEPSAVDATNEITLGDANVTDVRIPGAGFYIDGGNVGIGTATPAVALDVVGAISATGNLTSLGIDDNATSTAITIDSNENIGIGTASPNDTANRVTLELNDTWGGRIRNSIGGTANSEWLISTSNMALFGTIVSQPLAFTTNNLERMRIDSSGNVGIGTTSPNDTLHINGNVFIEGSSPEITFETTNASHYNWQIAVQENVPDALEISVGSADSDATNDTFSPVAVFKNSGNVGIGTSSPVGQLTLNKSSDLHFLQGGYGISWGATSGSAPRIIGSASSDVRFISGGGSETMRVKSDRLVVNTTGTNIGSTVAGCQLETAGTAAFSRSGTFSLVCNRFTNDGEIVALQQDGITEGTISVSGATVSYNGFVGSHWSRFVDESKPDVLRGTVMESLDQMTDWYHAEFETSYTEKDKDGNDVVKTSTQKKPYALKANEQEGDVITYAWEKKDEEGNDIIEQVQATIVKQKDVKHVMSKISDTVEAKNVYGVFSAWDNDDLINNDFYVASIGSYVVRIKQGETVAKGDLLQSNGDGTAKVQTDDVIRASTFAKVLSTTVIETYEDGSYLVPCSLMC